MVVNCVPIHFSPGANYALSRMLLRFLVSINWAIPRFAYFLAPIRELLPWESRGCLEPVRTCFKGTMPKGNKWKPSAVIGHLANPNRIPKPHRDIGSDVKESVALGVDRSTA